MDFIVPIPLVGGNGHNARSVDALTAGAMGSGCGYDGDASLPGGLC
jgi:hypothetical protein